MTGLPPGEWSAPYAGAPPEALEPSIEEVVRHTRSIAPPASGVGQFAVPDRPRVVTILGQRGTGKSTVLRFALRVLGERPNCIVLPVIDPEVFAIGDTLAGWVFAHLSTHLVEADKGFVIDEESTIGGLLEDLGRTQAVRGSAFLSGLEQRGLTFEDFGRDAVKVPGRGAQIGEDWSKLLDSLATARHQPALQLVIAVDDADLVPESLPTIVADAQMLGSSVRTAVIFAADVMTLRQSLELGLLSNYHSVASQALQHGLMSAQSVRELVSRRLVKSFPRSLRVALKPLDLRARLRFKPLGSEQTLLELLERVPMQARGYSRVSDLFQVRTSDGAVLEPSGHARCFSDNARDLRQLHEAITTIDPTGPYAAAHVLTMIIEHGIDAVSSELPDDAQGSIVMSAREDGRPGAAFDFRALTFGKTWIGGELLYRPSDSRQPPAILAPALMARYVSVFYVMRHAEAQLRREEESDAELRRNEHLPDQFAGLLSLAWEIVQEECDEGSLVRYENMAGRFLPPGGISWSSEVIVPGMRDARWGYWTVPNWEAFSDYYIFVSGWNRLAALLHDVDRKSSQLVEFMLIAHLRLIVQTQSDRTVPTDLAQLTSERLAEIVHPERWAERREQLVVALFEQIDALLRGGHPRRFVRDGDFAAWFYGEFPLCASRLFTTDELSARLLDYWKDNVPEGNRDAAVANLTDLARDHLDHVVAEADIQLLDRLDESQARLMRSVRDQLAREHDTRRTRVLHELTQSDAPPEVIEALVSTGLTREALLGLATAGVRAEVIALAAQAFPAKEPSEGGDDAAVADA